MSRETKLFINGLSHLAAAIFTLYLGYRHIDQPDTFTWCLTAVFWIAIAGYRNSELIKTNYAFDEVIEEATKTALDIQAKVTVNTLKVRELTKELQKDMLRKASIEDID